MALPKGSENEQKVNALMAVHACVWRAICNPISHDGNGGDDDDDDQSTSISYLEIQRCPVTCPCYGFVL